MIRTFVAVIFGLTCCTAAFAQALFPSADLLPKREIGATQFLEKHPEYDGRGVTVAVFDTGVDPAAPGLQTTTTGKPKIIDIVDGSGSGDVRTDTVRQANDGKLEGLTGRTLTIGKKWKNPSGDYHLGMKPAYELFPKAVLPRLRKERRKPWDEALREQMAKLTRELEAFVDEHPRPNDEQKQKRDELKKRIEQLTKLNEKWDDPGPIYDCVVFHDGKRWQAVVDTDEDGDLADEKLMTNYRDKRQYATFGEVDLVTYVVNIYEEGNLLSIVTDAGTHGTHVAGIIAAHYPSEPERNGIAPGAQIVSVKIGDTRVGSSSMGTGEVRGLITVLENKCDLINMSYGGPTPMPNGGRFAELYSEIVNRYGVIFVSSAGNSGPALSTVTGPGGTTSALLGVGAYVSPELMDAAYSLREKLDEMPFTWSSRGPTMDGDLGVDICAPGGAVAPVSRWALTPGQLMNGTSMSSPNACGGLALVLSGLKEKKIEFTPESVKLAAKNTARALKSGTPFSNGRGLLQVDAAFAWLEEHHKTVEPQVRYDVVLPGRRTSRGVYLREADEIRKTHEVTVEIDPEFNEDELSDPRANYQAEFTLKSTAPWVKVPENFYVHHGGRTFKLLVDPRELEPGAHFAEVEGYYSGHEEMGPRFRVPVTVIVPDADHESGTYREQLKLAAGQIDRTFVHVPTGSTWANLRIRLTEAEGTRLVLLHALQRLEDRPFDAYEQKDFLALEPGQLREVSFAVAEGKTLEVTLAQFWSSLGESSVEVEVSFHGLSPRPETLAWQGGSPIHRIDVTSQAEPMRIKPEARFDTLRKTLRPVKHEIVPLQADRDRLPDERQIYGLTLTYEFSLEEETKVTPHSVITADEHGFELYSGGLYTIYDANKRPVKFGGDDAAVTLGKGKYTLTYFFRHEEREKLTKLEDNAAWLDHELKSKPGVSVYDDYAEAEKDGRKFDATWIYPGQYLPVYLKLKGEDLPKAVAPGDGLLGQIQFGDPDAKLGGSPRRPEGFPLVYLVPPAPNKDAGEPDETVAEADKTEEPSLDDKLFEAKLAHLQTLKKKEQREAFDKLFDELQEEKPKHVPLLQARLIMLDENDRKEHLPEVVEAADAVLKAIPTKKVRAYFAERRDPETKEEQKKHQEMTERRDALIDTLYRKARAIAYMDLPTDDPEHPENADIRKSPKDPEKRKQKFERTFEQLSSWVDTTETKYALVHIRRLRRHNRPAEALELLNKLIEEDPAKLLLYKKRADLYEDLGWSFAREYENQWRKLRQREEWVPN